MNLNTLNGWQRICALISVIWAILATSLYFNALGPSNFPLHRWIVLWHDINPLASMIDLFEDKTGLEGYGNLRFDLMGFLFLVTLPPAVLLILGYGIAWVKRGFLSHKGQ